MILLAIDTATPVVTTGVVELAVDGTVRALASRATTNPRGHAEILTPLILESLAEAGLRPADLEAVVVGAGPGPFTGLRVGMATAAAFADALGIAVHGMCSLDAIAFDVAADRELLVVTDARRREVYWARYSGRRRIDGPHVCKPADLDVAGAELIAGSSAHAAGFDLPVASIESPSPVGLVGSVAAALQSGAEPEPLVPLYLRRPDAVERPAAAR